MPKLIMNADDYGHTPGVSAGIRQSHLQGIVTSTTAMMNMPDVEVALHQALRECPQLGLGVHLVLTTGAPLLPAPRVESLVADDFSFTRISDLIDRHTSLNLNEVKAEWHAQIERFIAITGHTPDHLDSHHHVSFLSPGLFQVMLELAQAFECAIRFPDAESAMEILSVFPAEVAQEYLKKNLDLVNQYQPRRPNHFLISFYDENATSAALLNFLENPPNGTIEIMCHPGYNDAELIGNSVYLHQREQELAILTDNNLFKFIEKANIELINFGHLKQADIFTKA